MWPKGTFEIGRRGREEREGEKRGRVRERGGRYWAENFVAGRGRMKEIQRERKQEQRQNSRQDIDR
jgi:hypothetical protein